MKTHDITATLSSVNDYIFSEPTYTNKSFTFRWGDGTRSGCLNFNVGN